MKSIMILSLVISLLPLLLIIPQTDAGTGDEWKLCQSSTECYYCENNYCTQDGGSWGWRTSVNPDRCGGNSDGWYCSGNIRENRDYKCNTGGTCTSSGGCTYTVANSEDCSTKTSTDTDTGNDPLTAGTVTDYTGCFGGSCTSNTYTDSCSGSTLTEYYPNGASYSSQTYNCEIYETLYCNTGNGDIYRNEWRCSDRNCNDGAADTLAQDCSNTCSDTDGGQVFTTQGTVTDNNLCSTGQTSCPSSTYTDSCSGTILTEYYCSGNDYASTTKNCNDYDSRTYDTTADTCNWSDYGCSSGACTSSSSNSLDCDTYDSVSGATANDYEVSSTSCTLGCTGSGCCHVDNTPNTCSATTSCQSTTVEGTSYKCHRSNAGAWQWDSGALPAETACSDTYDNDCDGLIDNADPTSCDATAPTKATVEMPANNGKYNSITSFSGKAKDNTNGVGLNANSVTFYIKRASDGKYWTGSTWSTLTWLSTTHSATTSDTEITWTSSSTLPTWSDGTYYAKAKAVDKAGNSFQGSEISYVYDATAPSCSISSITESSSYAHVSGSTVYYSTASTGIFTVTVSSSDASGIQKVNFPTTVSDGGDDTSLPYSMVYTWDTADTFDSSATTTCYDNAGNTNTATFTVDRDTTSPSDGSITYTDGYYTTASVAITLATGTDSESGVNTATDYIERQEAALSAGSCGSFGAWSTVKTDPGSSWTDTTVVNGKCYKYRYSVSDNVYNWRTYVSANTAKIDTTPPSVGQAEVYTGTTYQSGSNYWYKGTISIRAAASDSESGISSCEYTTDGSTWSSATYDGTYCKKDNLSPATDITINFRATNNAGNTRTGTSRSYTYDATVPTTSASATSPPDGAPYTFGTWTGNNVKVTLTCADNAGGSGCSYIQYCTDTANTCTPTTTYTVPFTISSEGTTYVRYRSTDNIGNVEATQSKTVKIDTTPPSVNIDSPAASSWQKSNFNLQYDATDNVAISTCKLYTKSSSESSWQDRGAVTCGTDKTATVTVGPTGYCKDEGSNKCQVKIWAQDAAGYTNEATRTFSIDWTLPSSSVSALDSCRATTSFTVRWSGSDTGGSGLACKRLWCWFFGMWGSDTGGSGIANYDIQYKKNAGSWTDCLLSTTSTSTTFPSGCSSPPTVANGDTFYFQSRARDNAGNIELYPASADTSTTIDQSGPNAPTNLQPPTGTLTSDNTPDFQWQPPSDNGCNGAISTYEIQIGATCGTGSTYSTTSTSYTPSPLSDGTYYWRVRAKDGLGNWGTWSSCNSIQIDTTVSAGISINTPPNDILTNTQSVTLYLSYPGDADQCRYSNDGLWDTEAWETCTPTKPWTLTTGYETKTVYYQVKDLAGNIGQALDSIDYVPNPSFNVKPPCENYGDVDGDGSITSTDSLWIMEYIVGDRTLTPEQLIIADVNNDDVVTMVDAIFIGQYNAGLRNTFPVCEDGGPLAVEGTRDFLHISWDITGFRTRDLMIGCELNSNATSACSSQQKQGTGRCTIINPAYDYTNIEENEVNCIVSYKDNPTISKSIDRTFRLIGFQVSNPNKITLTIGEQAEAKLTIKNKGTLQDRYSLSASIIPLALADKFTLRESTVVTDNVNANEIATTSFFITPLIEPAGSPSLKITVASTVDPSKTQEVSIPIETIKFVVGLSEFHFFGLIQIILLSVVLLYFSKSKK